MGATAPSIIVLKFLKLSFLRQDVVGWVKTPSDCAETALLLSSIDVASLNKTKGTI